MQQQLPFGVAEGIAIGREQALWLAVRRLNDRNVEILVQWVFRQTHRGQGEIEASYPKLAAAPWALASESAAKRAVTAAEAAGILRVARDARESWRPNRYAIDWDGVTRLLAGNPPAAECARDTTPGQPDTTPGQPDTTPGQPATTSAQWLADTPRLTRDGGGETPRAPAPASIGLCTSYKDKDVVDRSIDDGEFWKKAEAEMASIRRFLWPRATASKPNCWPTDPPDVRDVELVARLAALAIEATHRPWVINLLTAVRRNKPRKALAFLNSILRDFCPPGIEPRRLLASIVVPEWILRAVLARALEPP